MGRENLRAHDGVPDLIDFLRSHGVKIGLFTRNSTRGIGIMKELTGLVFDIEVSRDFDPPKPCTSFHFRFLYFGLGSEVLTLLSVPDGALHIAQAWGLDPSTILFVGDSGDDVNCGLSAGMKSVLFDPETKRPQLHTVASIVVKAMAELQLHLDQGILL